MVFRSKSASTTLLSFFGLLFIVAGLGVGTFYWDMLADWYRARTWVEVPCMLESSTLRDHMERRSSGSARDTLMNEAEATYTYSYQGRQYRGDRVSLSLGPDNFGGYQEHVANILQEARNAGGAFRCYVSEVRPEESVLFREARWTLLLFTGIFPLLFPLVGGWVCWTGWKGRRRRQKVHALQSRYPGEPWRWKPEWAGDWIQPKNRPLPWMWMVVTGWMLLVWGPMLVAVMVDSDVTKENPVSLLGLLPAVPLGLCILLTLRSWWLRFRPVPQVHVQPLPVYVGGPLNAQVALPPFKAVLHGSVGMRLSCHKEWTETDSENSTITRREERWTTYQSVPLASAILEGQGSRLSVTFDIPASLPAEDLQRIGTEEFDFLWWVWELELSGAGLNRQWLYDMPVYLPHQPLEYESPEAVEAAQAQKEIDEAENAAFRIWQMQNLDADELEMHLARRHIGFVFEKRSKMPVRFDLSSRRFSRAKPLVVFFTLIWVVMALGIVKSDLPFIFTFLWGGSSLLLIWLLSGLFKSRTLHLDEHGLTAGWKLGPFGKSFRVHRQEIVRFRVSKTGMRINHEQYNKVILERQGGDKIVVLDGLAHSPVPESLALLLEQWRKQA